MPKYEAVIGLEIHIQLRTKSKMFCRCDNQSEGAVPNANTCPVCLGMPGTLPVPNRTAIEWALKTAAALGCTIPKTSKFDRKQYFYPDLPKGYQISQYDEPLGGPGSFSFDLADSGSVTERTVGITRLHLEEDAGKLNHPKGEKYSLVDLNRAGTPLMEIVTEPDFRTPAEAKAFLQELRKLARYLQVSEADMEKGHLRADANISMREAGAKELGAKAELKNLNSFKFVERGLEAEILRQTALLEAGEAVAQETRGFDEDSGKTVSQRGKEEAQDYRYFPEPDIPPLDTSAWADQLSDGEELPVARGRRWRTQGIPEQAVQVVVEDREESEAFDATVGKAKKPKEIALRWLSLRNSDAFPPGGWGGLKEFLTPIGAAGNSSDIEVAAILTAVQETGKPAEEILKKGLPSLDDDHIGTLVDEGIAANAKAVADYKAGNENAKQVIVGFVMKKTKGSANPTTVAQLVAKKLGK